MINPPYIALLMEDLSAEVIRKPKSRCRYGIPCVPSRRNSRYKGPKEGKSLLFLRKRKKVYSGLR